MSALPLQTYASPGRPLWQPFGTTSQVSSFTDASISSLTVSSINGLPADQVDVAGWSFFPAVTTVDLAGNNIIGVPIISGSGPTFLVDAGLVNNMQVAGSNVEINCQHPNGKVYFTNSFSNIATLDPSGFSVPNINTSSVQGSTISGLVGGFSTITTSTLTANTIFALSTISVTSTISTTVLNAQAITNLSSINGQPISSIGNPADWSLFPAISSINCDGNDIINLGEISSYPNQPIYQTASSFFFRNEALSDLFDINADGSARVHSHLTVDSYISTPSLNVSTINGIEFVGGGGGSVTLSSITSQAFSTIGASIQQGLMSSIVINPQINPTFNVDLGMGNFLTTLGTGLFGVAVAVPTTAGTITYGLTKGLASLFEPKPVLNNIAVTSNFEVYNYQTQLQVSTLGHYVSTIYQFVSTIPSTIVINTSNINSTIDFIDVPYFISTVSQSSTPTCIRSIADPTTTVSTPWTYSQSLPEWGWVELPSSIAGGGGIGSNVSTLSLSTLTLAPSTIVKGDLDGAVMEVLEAGALTNYGEVKSAGYWTTLSVGSPNFGIYTMNAQNEPSWINSNISSFTFAFESKPPLAFYVSPAGNDGYATGSINNPYKTIQSAINSAEAVSSGTNQALVIVAPGQYNENLTFNKGYVTVMGDLNTQDGNQITSLNGDITVNCGFSDDLVARQVILQGLQIDGRLNDTSPNQHTLIIQDCKFFDTDTMVYVNPSATNQRTFITNSEFVQTGASTQPCLQFNVGQVQLERVDIDNSTNNTVLLYVSGTATVARCNFGNFESGTTATGTGVAPIVSVDSTSASVHTFGFTNIYYTSASNKTGTANATGILFTTNVSMTAIVLNCVFTLTGTSDLANQFIMKPFGAGLVTLLQADNQSSPAGAGSCTQISPVFVRADYVIPSMTAGIISSSQITTSSINANTISSITSRTSTLTANTISSISERTSSLFANTLNANQVSSFGVSANSISVSTLTVNDYIDLGKTNFANQAFIVGGISNHPLIETEVIVSPYIDTVTYINGLTNSNATGGYISLVANNGLVGINKIPEPGFVLDVDSTIRTKVGHFSGQVLTSSIMAPSTFCEVKSLVGEISLTPNPSWWVGINSGVVAGDNQGLIKFGQSEIMLSGYNGGENYIANQIYPGSYSGGTWTNYTGRAVRIEYGTLTDSSFPSGLGMGEIVLPIGISTLLSFQGTYDGFGNNNPGINHPVWLYSTINDANGQISTIQFGGEANTGVYGSVVGFV